MEVQLTCEKCQSSIEVIPSQSATKVKCSVCDHIEDIHFSEAHESSLLKECPKCSRKDFYKQKDFNRKVGVFLFVVGACFVPWTYGFSLVALWLVDLFLFSKIGNVVICYKCNTNFRKVSNSSEIAPFNHEMNDRIVYSDHDFEGKVLEH